MQHFDVSVLFCFLFCFLHLQNLYFRALTKIITLKKKRKTLCYRPAFPPTLFWCSLHFLACFIIILYHCLFYVMNLNSEGAKNLRWWLCRIQWRHFQVMHRHSSVLQKSRVYITALFITPPTVSFNTRGIKGEISPSPYSQKTIRPVLLAVLTRVKSVSPCQCFVLVPCSIGNSLYRSGTAVCILSPRENHQLLVLPHVLFCTHYLSQPVTSCYGKGTKLLRWNAI